MGKGLQIIFFSSFHQFPVQSKKFYNTFISAELKKTAKAAQASTATKINVIDLRQKISFVAKALSTNVQSQKNCTII